MILVRILAFCLLSVADTDLCRTAGYKGNSPSVALYLEMAGTLLD